MIRPRSKLDLRSVGPSPLLCTILLVMIIALAVAGLAGCAGITSATAPSPKPGPPSLHIASSSLPVGTVGASYSTTLAATGGTPPYTWSTTSGTLPTGLQLNSSTGIITGTPTMAGGFSFTSQVQDAKASSSSAGFSLSISSAPAPTISDISPNSGSINGGTTVTISGSNFVTGATVRFGSVAATVQSLNSNQITALTPAEASGSVNVTVQNTDGQIATAPNAFTFTSASGGTVLVTPTPSSDPAAPKIFNASSSAQPG